jgi:Fic family protein
LRGHYERRTWPSDPIFYAPARYRRACHYDTFLPLPLEKIDVNLSGPLAAMVSEAESAILDLNASGNAALAPLARLLLRTESIASSKIEGMKVDARILARAEVAGDIGQRASPNALEVIANIDAMQLAIEQATAEDQVGIGQLIDVHRTLLKDAQNSSIAGHIRAEQNWIGGNDYNPCGADFVPPPPEMVVPLLSDLCRFSSEESLPPLVQAAIAHAQFETIHPFADGNGRTGRALVQTILRRRGLAPEYVPPVSVVLAQNRDRYIGGLTAFRDASIDAWLEVFVTSAAQAARLARHYLHEVESLQERWRNRLRESAKIRADAAAWKLIDVLPELPLITLRTGVVKIRRTKPAVNLAIAQLADAAILIPLTEGQRNRAWKADGLLDLLMGLESGELAWSGHEVRPLNESLAPDVGAGSP